MSGLYFITSYVVKYDPEFLPKNNILDMWRAQIKRHNVISDEFNALFYYEYIMYLMGLDIQCLKLKKN